MMYYKFIEEKSYDIDEVPHKVYTVEHYKDKEKTDFSHATSLVAAGDQVDKPNEIFEEACDDKTSASSPGYIVERKQAYPSIEEQLDMQ